MDYKRKRDMRKEAKEKIKKLGDPKLDPFEINFLPEHEQARGSRGAFINEYDVVIGDHEYESPNSPLENWSTDTDPAVMAGDQWVHGYKDIGFHSKENREYFEEGIEPQEGIFMHPSHNVDYPVQQEKAEEKDINNDKRH